MARLVKKEKKNSSPEKKKETIEIFSQSFLEDLVNASQREVLPNLEKLISIQGDTKIIQGQPPHYYRYLYFLAHTFRPKLSVELGTWKGLSAACLADGYPEGKIITIDRDPSPFREDARRSNIEYWVQNSLVSLKHEVENIDILFIDGDHEGQCLEEYRFWLPRMNNKSMVLFDDINLGESMRAFWKNFNPIAGVKFDLPIHGEAGFGMVLINN